MAKKLRFFYHYNRIHKALTLHYKGQCHTVKDIDCSVPTESHWNEKQQPNLVMRGFCSDVKIENNKALIL